MTQKNVSFSDEQNAPSWSFSGDRGVVESTSREAEKQTTSPEGVMNGGLASSAGQQAVHDSLPYENATFAGGCFWCLQGPFDAEKGVSNVEVGYAGGTEADANYSRVCTGTTQHREAIHMQFDPKIVSYETLLDIFWRQIDPTDPYGQFNDQGPQYTTAIYYHTQEQRTLAEASRDRLNASGKFAQPIATAIVSFTTFFPAEAEHQAYYKKNPLRYGMYKMGSGRASFIEKNWKA